MEYLPLIGIAPAVVGVLHGLANRQGWQAAWAACAAFWAFNCFELGETMTNDVHKAMEDAVILGTGFVYFHPDGRAEHVHTDLIVLEAVKGQDGVWSTERSL